MMNFQKEMIVIASFFCKTANKCKTFIFMGV